MLVSCSVSVKENVTKCEIGWTVGRFYSVVVIPTIIIAITLDLALEYYANNEM